MSRAEKMRHAIDVAERVFPEAVEYAFSASGEVSVYGDEGVALAALAAHAPTVEVDSQTDGDGWYGPGPQRAWLAVVDGVQLKVIERHNPAKHGRRPGAEVAA